jgi:ketosteroid isomerase-like protein
MKSRRIVLLGFILACCSPDKEEEKNLAITHALFDAFNQHDWEKVASMYSENASFLDPSYGREYVKKLRSEIAMKYAELEKIFPDIRDDITGMYPSGDKVIVEFQSTGSVSDSVKFKLPIISVLTFKEGQIIKDVTYYDLENP